MQARNIPFRHLTDLISVLCLSAPALLLDLHFLRRSVLVDGVTPTTTPRDLLHSFPLLDAQAAVLVRDSHTGHRVGLVVFSDAAESMRATRLTARPGFYSTCMPVSSCFFNPL